MKRLYKTEFHAAHRIEGHPKCGWTHGHSYQLQVEVDFDEYKWIDFAVIKQVVEVAIAPYDHVDIGDMTVERLARTLQLKLAKWFEPLIGVGGSVTVELWETSHFGVRT